MEDQEFNREKVWTRYWANGAMHSCSGSYDDQYGDTIAKFWLRCFDSLPVGSRILDIGTGNGPLPRLLFNLSNRPDLTCDAIDLAMPRPTWLDKVTPDMRSRVRFHSHCCAESLPFPDRTFDLVISQWGMEYTDLGRSSEEVLRVLKPSGMVKLIVHHPQSLPSTLAIHEIEHIKWLFEESGYLDVATQMLIPMAIARTEVGRAQLMSNPQATALRSKFNSSQDAITSRIETCICPDVLAETQSWVTQLFAVAQHAGASEAQTKMQGLRIALRDTLFRLQELVRHAMNDEKVTSLGARLASRGAFSQDVLRDQEHVIGWTLHFEMRDAD